MIWGAGFPLEVLSPLDNLDSFAQQRVLALGWPQNTPIAQRISKYLGVDSLPDALSQGRQVRFLGITENYKLLSQFLRDHYDLDLVFQEQYRGRQDFEVVGQFLPPQSHRGTARPRIDYFRPLREQASTPCLPSAGFDRCRCHRGRLRACQDRSRRRFSLIGKTGISRKSGRGKSRYIQPGVPGAGSIGRPRSPQ